MLRRSSMEHASRGPDIMLVFAIVLTIVLMIVTAIILRFLYRRSKITTTTRKGLREIDLASLIIGTIALYLMWAAGLLMLSGAVGKETIIYSILLWAFGPRSQYFLCSCDHLTYSSCFGTRSEEKSQIKLEVVNLADSNETA